MTTQGDIVDKVQKLLRLANDSAATDGEKANAMRMATDLMHKYDIEEATIFVQDREAGRKDDIILQSFRITKETSDGGRGKVGDSFVPEQRLQLAYYIANYFGCKSIVERREATADVETGDAIAGGKWLTVTGWRHDVELTKGLYDVLVIDLATTLATEPQKGRNYRVNFATGYVERINERLQESARARRKANDETAVGGTSMALVLVDKKDAVEKAYKDMFGETGRYRSSENVRYDGAANARGRKAGEKADLASDDRKVGGTARGQLT